MSAAGFPVFDAMDDAQKWVLKELIERGARVSPRGKPTLELFPLAFRLRYPRNRLISIPERRWSLPLAVGEFCWHAAGSNEVSSISYYARKWWEFSPDGSTIQGSCYGRKVFARQISNPSPWDKLLDLLRNESDTRRAILYFGHLEDLFNTTSLDVACASSFQFLIRDGKLDGILYMRSNDAVLGLPYDVFLFTMIQELLACQLGLELGSYFHFAGSMHLYENQLDLAQRVLKSRQTNCEEMPSMSAPDQLPHFLRHERAIRIGCEGSDDFPFDTYWSDLLSVLRWFRSVRSGIKEVNFEDINNPLYAGLLMHGPRYEVHPNIETAG